MTHENDRDINKMMTTDASSGMGSLVNEINRNLSRDICTEKRGILYNTLM